MKRIFALLAVLFYAATAQAAYYQPPGPVDAKSYTFATLPAKVAGRSVYCSDCIKPNVVYGQSQTGTPVYTDGTNWFNGESPLSNPTPATHTGLIATNTSFPQITTGANKSVMSRTHHVMQDSVTSLQVVFGNIAGNSEAAPGATTSIKASIEFPDGVFTPLLFSGSATGTIPNGGTLTSDALTITIRKGETIWVRQFLNNTVTIGYSTTGDIVNGEGGEFSTTVNAGTDKTATGTVTANSNVVYPFAIIGTTKNNGICLFGDSRTYTQVDAPVQGQQSDSGLIPRSLAEYYAYTSLHYPAETAQMAVATHAIKNAIAAYCTHVISEYGVVDLGGTARTATQLLSDQQSIAGWSNVTGKPFTLVTISPYTTSTDNWATIANQTAVSNSAQITSYNGTLRTAQPAWVASVIDEAYFMESSQNSTLWKVDGTANKYTPDGLHYTGFGVQTARDRDEVDLGYFGWSQAISPGTIKSSMLSNGASAFSQLNGAATIWGDLGVGTLAPAYNIFRQQIGNCPTWTNSNIIGGCLLLSGTGALNPAIGFGDATNSTYWIQVNNGGTLVWYRTNAIGAGAGITNQGMAMSVNGVSFPSAYVLALGAGSTGTPPFTLSAGTVLTTPQAGAIEMDANGFYSTVNNGRGVMPSVQIITNSSTRSLTSQTAAQKLFNSPTNGQITLPTGSFEFECEFSLTSMSASSGSFGFALGVPGTGAATFTQSWRASAFKAAALTTPVAEQVTINTTANTTLATATTSQGSGAASIKGIIRVTVAGGIIPQVSLGVAAAAVVGVNSFCKFWPFGSSSAVSVGNWS